MGAKQRWTEEASSKQLAMLPREQLALWLAAMCNCASACETAVAELFAHLSDNGAMDAKCYELVSYLRRQLDQAWCAGDADVVPSKEVKP